jgi:hypothetical protein
MPSSSNTAKLMMPEREAQSLLFDLLKGEREYKVKRLVDCRLKGEARPDYILSPSTGKLRPLPPPSNTPPQATNKPDEMQQRGSTPSTPLDYILYVASLNSPNPMQKTEKENQQQVSMSMSMSVLVCLTKLPQAQVACVQRSKPRASLDTTTCGFGRALVNSSATCFSVGVN